MLCFPVASGSLRPRNRKQLCHVMSSSTASGSPIERSVRPAGSSRGIAGKSDPTSSRSGPSMSMRYPMARRSNTSESYQNRRASSAGPVAAAQRAASGPREPGGSSFQVRPQNHWARGSGSGNPPAAWLNASRSRGYFSATPPVTRAAAASAPSMPTPNVAAAGPGSRSDAAGTACTKIAVPSRSASAKNSQKRGSPSDTPPTLEAISTPARPAWATSASSPAARSGSCSGTVPSP